MEETYTITDQRNKTHYNESKLVKSLIAGVALTVLTSGCASYEARQITQENPYRHLTKEQNSHVVPKGSPRSDSFGAPLWFSLLEVFVK